MTTTSRVRSGSQLAIELPPELMQRLKAHAAANDQTVSALVRRWIEIGLDSAQPNHNTELADLVDLVVSLKDEVSELQSWRKSQQSTQKDWVENLRLKIKQKHGRGWIIRGIAQTKINPNGRCQLTKIAKDRTRTSVMLPLKWHEDESSSIYEMVNYICTVSSEKGLLLGDALNLLK